MTHTPLIDKLIRDLQVMPGIGPRSAQRIAFYLLDRNREGALQLSSTLKQAMNIGYCKRCRNFSEGEYCEICSDKKRIANKTICVVESPADAFAIEKTQTYFGTYFILHGCLSPIDSIGPKELHLDTLHDIIKDELPNEIIIATSATVEGDATAHLIASYAKKYNVNISKPAYGIPLGCDIDNLDHRTLSKSLEGRIRFGNLGNE
jgi:recombination protein RecR